MYYSFPLLDIISLEKKIEMRAVTHRDLDDTHARAALAIDAAILLSYLAVSGLIMVRWMRRMKSTRGVFEEFLGIDEKSLKYRLPEERQRLLSRHSKR